MISITINGKTFTGLRNLNFINGSVVIDGSKQMDSLQGVVRVEITGGVLNVECDAPLIVNGNVQGNVECDGPCTCGDIEGNVEVDGPLTCGNIKGDVDADGPVTCGNVGGDVTADMVMRS